MTMNTIMFISAAFAALALMQCVAAQTVHVVGDGIGWAIPQGGASAYVTWAASKTFMVGDILEFNFETNNHDVLQVPKASFDACTSDNPIGSFILTGPANVTLTTSGDHYYICTLGRHCSAGQKLSITVSATPGVSPSLSPNTTPTSTATNNTVPADCVPEPAPSPIVDGPTTQPPMWGSAPPHGSSSYVVTASFVFSVMSIILAVWFV